MASALVVDDNENIRRLVSRVLQRLDLETDEASGGAEALEKLKQREYDIVLLDLMMPKPNGFDVIRTLQETSPESLNRIVVMTAATGHLTDELLGCVRKRISKPFSIAELSAIIRECVAEEQLRLSAARRGASRAGDSRQR